MPTPVPIRYYNTGATYTEVAPLFDTNFGRTRRNPIQVYNYEDEHMEVTTREVPVVSWPNECKQQSAQPRRKTLQYLEHPIKGCSFLCKVTYVEVLVLEADSATDFVSWTEYETNTGEKHEYTGTYKEFYDRYTFINEVHHIRVTNLKYQRIIQVDKVTDTTVTCKKPTDLPMHGPPAPGERVSWPPAQLTPAIAATYEQMDRLAGRMTGVPDLPLIEQVPAELFNEAEDPTPLNQLPVGRNRLGWLLYTMDEEMNTHMITTQNPYLD